MNILWSKNLSRSDAQIPVPNGWPVPYLRLTNSGHAQNTQAWFRQVVFANLNWQPGNFGLHAVEIAKLHATIILPGKSPAQRVLMVTHDDGRASSGKNTPNTWIHWDDVTRDELRVGNYAGRLISLEVDPAGAFVIRVV